MQNPENFSSTFHQVMFVLQICKKKKRIFSRWISIHVKIFERKNREKLENVLTGNLFWWEFILNDPLEKQSISELF